MKKITLLFLLLNVSFLLQKEISRKDALSGTPGVNIVEKEHKTGSQLIWMVLTKLKLNKVHDRFSYIGFSMWKKQQQLL
jgi:hypothetical protein